MTNIVAPVLVQQNNAFARRIGMLSLPEQLLLLALGDKTGTDVLGAALDRALIAAALIDLHLQGRVVRREPGVYDPNHVIAGEEYRFWCEGSTYYLSDNATATEEAYLDHVFSKIAVHPSCNRLHSFTTLALTYLGRTNTVSPNIFFAPPNQRLLAAQDLLAREVLVVRESRMFGMLLETRLSEGNRDTGEPQLRRDLQSVVGDSGFSNDDRFRALLLLIQAMGLVGDIWGTAKHDVADWRISHSLRLTMESRSIFADARRYIISGVMDEELQPFLMFAPVPR